MAHLFQVGAGSGGMPVLDMVCRDERITRVTLVEPDVYKPHNVERHLFPLSAVGQKKAELAQQWLLQRRYRRQVVFMPGFSRARPGSSMVRVNNAGPRPKEVSTVDVPAPGPVLASKSTGSAKEVCT